MLVGALFLCHVVIDRVLKVGPGGAAAVSNATYTLCVLVTEPHPISKLPALDVCEV